MKFIKDAAQVLVPDGIKPEAAFRRTTALCIAAHQDDTEIMAYHAIAECYGEKNKWFTSVILTDGAGSPRSGVYADHSDEDMKRIRAKEQNAAALVGGYSAQIQLGYSSAEVKKAGNVVLIDELTNIIAKCLPEVVYTHNLADKHDTHVATALRVIAAIKKLPEDKRPSKLYGMEVWRDLDWLADSEKSVFDASVHENLAQALLGLFDSQVCGGKRYDLAALGRRKANATFLGDHATDEVAAAIYGIDMTELFVIQEMTPEDFILKRIEGFRDDVESKLKRLSK